MTRILDFTGLGFRVVKKESPSDHFRLSDEEHRLLVQFLRSPEAGLMRSLIVQEIDHQGHLLVAGGKAEADDARVYQGKCSMLAEFWRKVEAAGNADSTTENIGV